MKLSATRVYKWTCWAGDIDRIARLAAILDSLVEPKRAPVLAALARKHDEDYDKWERSVEPIDDDQWKDEQRRWRIDHDATERDGLRARWSVILTIREPEFGQTYTGTTSEVLGAADPASVQHLQLRGPAGPGTPISCKIGFHRKPGLLEDACSLEVSGDDPGWVRQAFVSLSDEIKRGVPWWAFLRTPFAIGLYFVISIAALAPVFWSRRTELTADGTELDVWSVLIVSAAMSGGIAFLTYSLSKRLIPGFELLPRGGSPQARRVVAVAGSLIGQLAIGLIFTIVG